MAGGGSTQVLANALGRIARLSVAIGVLGGAAQSSLFVVNGGERAVIFNRFTGVEQNVRGEVRCEAMIFKIAVFLIDNYLLTESQFVNTRSFSTTNALLCRECISISRGFKDR